MLESMRTGVQGFADLCLATRPRDRINYGPQIYIKNNANVGLQP